MSDVSMSTSGTLSRPLPADGIVGLYADRALDRGADPRAMASMVRHSRLSHERLPVMSDPFGIDVPLANPVMAMPRLGSRRLIAAGIVVLLLLPLGALVAGEESPTITDNFTANAARDLGLGSNLPHSTVDGMADIGIIPNPVFSVPLLGYPTAPSGGSVTVDGRERRNQVDANVYTTEESEITIDGETVESNGRPPLMQPNVHSRLGMP